jgi:hypothetical protein
MTIRSLGCGLGDSYGSPFAFYDYLEPDLAADGLMIPETRRLAAMSGLGLPTLFEEYLSSQADFRKEES